MALRNSDLPCAPIDPIPLRTSRTSPRDPLIARLTVEGIRCQHCVTRIGNALATDSRVLGVRVEADRGFVDVLFDAARMSTEELAALIRSSAQGSPRHYAVTRTETASTSSRHRPDS